MFDVISNTGTPPRAQTQVTPSNYKFIPYTLNDQGQLIYSDEYDQSQLLFKKKVISSHT